jgi:hypothetical protein
LTTIIPNTEQSSKGKGKTHKSTNRQISQQPENWENRNGPDLVQAFPKKWWVESDITAPNLPLPLRVKGSGCHYRQGYEKIRLIRSLKKFIFRYHDLVEKYFVSAETIINDGFS